MRVHSSRRLILFCGLMSIVLFASSAMAQQRGRRATTPGGFAEGRMMKKNAKDLGLSEETVAKIDAALEAGKDEETKLRESGMAAINELNEVLAKNLPTKKELIAASDKVGENAKKSRMLKMNSVIELRSLLTPEQLEKFMEIRKKATARR
jgi:Spy/CpxP family protein refolding chaperone